MTLLAGALVAGVIYVVNVNLSSDAERTAAESAAAAQATPAVTASAAVESPAPTATPAAPTSAVPVTAPAGKGTYAGETDDGAAGLAIATDDGAAVAYICDGKAAEAWLKGTAAGGQISLKGPKGSLAATYTDKAATGTVTAGKKTWKFTLKLAKPPSGLYRSAANVRAKLDASWAVTPDGKQYGVQWVDGTARPAPAFDTATNTAQVDGVPLRVEPSVPDSAGS